MKILPQFILCFALPVTGAVHAEGPDEETTGALFGFAFMVPWRERRSAEDSTVSIYAGGVGEPGGVTHGAHATVILELDDQDSVAAVDIRYWAD